MGAVEDENLVKIGERRTWTFFGGGRGVKRLRLVQPLSPFAFGEVNLIGHGQGVSAGSDAIFRA
jgi:hypothetical protein